MEGIRFENLRIKGVYVLEAQGAKIFKQGACAAKAEGPGAVRFVESKDCLELEGERRLESVEFRGCSTLDLESFRGDGEYSCP